jgi:hypothetical protein
VRAVTASVCVCEREREMLEIGDKVEKKERKKKEEIANSRDIASTPEISLPRLNSTALAALVL